MIHKQVGRKVSGPNVAPEQDRRQSRPAPPGHFLSSELESDCARFLDELRARLRRRAEAERVSPPRAFR
jgi:hypothetical protein